MSPQTLVKIAAASVIAQSLLSPDAPAQDARTAVGNDFIALGVGAAPEFIGSDDLEIVPFVAGTYETRFVDISIEGTSLRLDFLGPQTSRVLRAGPVFTFRGGRDDVDDPVIDRLEDVDDAAEIGGFIGFDLRDLALPGDEFFTRLEVTGDVSDSHNGFLITPSAGYGAPVLDALRASVDVSLNFGSREFNETFFSVSQRDAAASGLPTFEADAGLYGVTLGTGLAYAITDTWGVVGRVSYTRLSGDASDSPIVERGSQNQVFVGAGVSYRF